MSTPQGSRFSEYNPSDHQAPLWIATSITLAYTGLLLLVRLAIKIKLLALDDLFLAVAHIVGIAQWGIMYASLNDGVGRKVFGIEQSNAAKVRILP
ncbi:uncharacterized protein KY384_008972 [Bacidia gigantensis]|uniref:uncharacterized protein n=1 Tax=Bacidia gigantensis TaxID=2732470 RepID=UPI001D03DC1E|nr:uncharacterized protein KY384_008972 [Bacidia gigantensis]KAG8525328.1 hypothetical protein KY384_008972 [Bacidia gigantensis]